MENEIEYLKREKYSLTCKIKVLEDKIQDLKQENDALIRSMTLLNNEIKYLEDKVVWLTVKVQLYVKNYELEEWLDKERKENE